MKCTIAILPQLVERVLFPIILMCGFLLPANVKAQLPNATQVAGRMKVGWNLGNTLECPAGETSWGAAYTTQRLIDSVKAVGFNSVRIPCAWLTHSDTVTNVIYDAWLLRVKEVVDYCLKDSMYVIINIHWDSGWLEKHVTQADSARVKSRIRDYWTQIATYFKEYDEHLLFAGTNEPAVHDSAGMAILLSYHRTFIDAVRSTGGNNGSRILIVQGPSTDIEKTNELMKIMPADPIENRLMVEVHYYTPYQFTLMEKDESWGNMFYYWGKGNHSATDVTRNATWGEESDMEKYLGLMKTQFIDKGIPVIIGEYGAFRKKLSPPSDPVLHNTSVEYFYRYFVNAAMSRGIITFCWDTPGAFFDRSTGVVQDRNVVNAIMQGARDVTRDTAGLKENDTY
jgi:endoglucanase